MIRSEFMPTPITRIVKVGGSLFDLPNLGEQVQAWLDRQTPAGNVLFAGGGEEVDRIRSECKTAELGEHEAHWQCIKALSATASHLGELMPGVTVQTHIPFPPHRTVIFSCATWLKNIEPLVSGTRLLASWDVTSDSIAARLAICIDADELVLLKSADSLSKDLQLLTDAGYIDKFFPRLAGEIPPLRIVNLRKE